MIRLRYLSIIFICSFCLLIPVKTVYSEVQTIPLNAGWNLISLQVEPFNSGIQYVQSMLKNPETGENDPNAFICIWSYKAEMDTWKRFVRNLPLLEDYPVIRLDQIESKKGYWIKVARIVNLVVEGEIAKGQIDFIQGWNLIGFTGFSAGDNERLDVKDILGPYWNQLDQIWMYDAQNAERFKGYDLNAYPPVEDFTYFKSGYGYWVHTLASFSLSPELGVTLRPDIDVIPFGNFPGPEDTDIDGDGHPDTREEQNTISFDETVNNEGISIINKGSGILNWQIITEIPWIDLDYYQGTTSTDREQPLQTGNNLYRNGCSDCLLYP